MISAEAFDAYNKAVADMSDGLAEQCAARVLAFCETHPNATVAEIREFAIEVMDGFVQVAGEAAATLAAEWYDARMSEEGLSLPAAITAVVYKPEKVEDVARYQARKLVKGDMQGFAERCGEYVRNEALASLNETIIANVERDAPKGVRYARVTTGRSDCAFCLMLESRGAVYKSRASAGEIVEYHRRCDCKIVPGVPGNPDAILVEGHDPAGIRGRMAIIEKQTGLSFSNKEDWSLLSMDMQLRDSDWIYQGRLPCVEYCDDETRELKKRDPDHKIEKRTAERLAANGYKTVFITDEISIADPNTGAKRIIGLSDLENGIEIKNVSSALSENTISKHIANSKKKRGCKTVAIDVFENEGLSDERAEQMVSNSLRRHKLERAILIKHDGRTKIVYK